MTDTPRSQRPAPRLRTTTNPNLALAEVGTKSLADLSANTVYQPRSRADVRVWKQDLQHLVNLLAGEMGEGEPYRDARATLSRLFGEYVEIPEPKVTRRRQAATE